MKKILFLFAVLLQGSAALLVTAPMMEDISFEDDKPFELLFDDAACEAPKDLEPASSLKVMLRRIGVGLLMKILTIKEVCCESLSYIVHFFKDKIIHEA
ncbi:MAG: hypothetical protein WC707_05380 [Candidatus Babeliaceae bacterium]|jgi:hypothetical protein